MPEIFDRALLRLRLARALKAGAADFLLTRVVEDLIERVSLVRRDFSAILDLGTAGPASDAGVAGGLSGRADDACRADRGGAGGGASFAADVETTALELERHDLVVSALALQHVDDLPGLLARARRALKPDGLLMAAMAGGRSLHELRACLAQAEDEARGGASPRVAPFVDLRDLGALAQRAGFALPVADVETIVVRYRDMFGLMRDVRAMGATNALKQRGRPLTRGILARAAELYAERHADADGRVRATFEIVWLSGWAPHASQQKPLKPGQGKTPLAEALAAAKAERERG
ncbi:MAG: methyltransferase domain-containing protein [Rhodoblastus sp.]|nr:MAG: methyltransferase domain-containing protein [Rhodoblastus sp.]